MHYIFMNFLSAENGLSFYEQEWLKCLVTFFLAILFLQSGFDKVFDYKGNLSYFKAHFKNSPLAPLVGLLLPVITLLETLAGLFCAAGTVAVWRGDDRWGFIGTSLAAISLTSLFLGQRLAKDYEGAAVLVPYFLLALFGLYLYAPV